MLAFASIVAFFYAIHQKHRLVFLFVGVYLSVFLHLLSVRIGMLSLYLGLLLLVFFIFHKFNKKRYILVFSALLFLMPALSYQFIPSFKNRINYMKYDWQAFQKGEYGHNSDSRRLLSLQVGLELIKEQPIIGLSPDQMKQKINEFYLENYPSIESHNRKLPHNQILYTWLELGLFAVIILVLAFLIPIVNHSFCSHPLLYALLFIIFTSMMFDNTLETQLGMSFYAIFFSLLLNKEIE
jgi:O-antigen ligase